jgi:putative DNA-invertase from lambdoid prophage Rac
MRIFGYCRASTAEPANSGPLLEAQRRQIDNYAQNKGWPAAEFFVEKGVSGSIQLGHRAEGQRLLTALQPGDIIVTAKLDYVSRTASEILGTLEKLKKMKIALHVVDLGCDITENAAHRITLERRALIEQGDISDAPATAQIIDFKEHTPAKDR